MIDNLFSNYQWYRRWRGGDWYYIRTRLDCHLHFWWSRKPPAENSYINTLIKDEQW